MNQDMAVLSTVITVRYNTFQIPRRADLLHQARGHRPRPHDAAERGRVRRHVHVLAAAPRRGGVVHLEVGMESCVCDVVAVCADAFARSLEESMIVPLSGRSIPESKFSSVLLPEPEGPIKATRSPA